MSQTKSKPNIWARRKARRALVQAAYQWQFANSDLAQLPKEFAESALDKADDEFFADILARMINNSDALDDMLAPLLDRPIEQLDMVERGVLRLAAVELSERIDVPYRVVIDEYVELTKLFGSEDAYKFVNGVLDKLSAQQRHWRSTLIRSNGVNGALIDSIANALGDSATAPWIRVGIGDDAAVMRARDGFDQVASIDTLVADVHFPNNAPELIGYRALMVSLSDLAAMAAVPRYALVALTLPEVAGDTCQQWVQRLASGMAAAAQETHTALCGGNVSRGPLSISVSVHGEVEAGQARLRSTAAAGEGLYVSGPLGSAAACVRTNQLLPVTTADAQTLSSTLTIAPRRARLPSRTSSPPAQLIFQMACCKTLLMCCRPADVAPT